MLLLGSMISLINMQTCIDDQGALNKQTKKKDNIL